MQVTIARSPAELDRLRSRWEYLVSFQQHTIFQTFVWNRFASQFFSRREAPYVVLAENSSGAALIPAAIAGGAITFLGETLFDYRDVLVLGDREALNAAWRELARLQLPLAVTAIRSAASHWDAFSLQPFSEAPWVSASRYTADSFAAAHNRSGRFFRRLARQRVELKCYPGSASALIAEVYRHKGAQPFANNLFTDPCRVEFMLAVAAADPSSFDIYTLETAGSLLGALVTLHDGNIRRFYTTWFDPAWAHHSPGTALLFEVTCRSLAGGLDCDYMTGAQPYKLRFATDSVPLFRAQASADELSHRWETVEDGFVPEVRAA